MPQAALEVEEITASYVEVSPPYARRLVSQLKDAVKRLEAFPLSGCMVPEIEDGQVREVVHRGYRIFYYYDAQADRVEVVSVRHASRQFGA